jgi:DNA polymerase III alpha subunit
MINLKIKTEYTFRNRYGRIKDIIKHVGNVRALAITDEQSTWGHSEFVDSCRKAGIKPILGVCLNIVLSLESERKQDSWQVTLLARNLEGLKEIYRINSKSYDQLYYKPRTTIDEINNLSRNIIVLLGSNPHPLLKPKHAIFYYEFNPGFARYNQILKKEAKDNCVVTSDNYYPSKSDKSAYEAISEFTDKKLSPQHILTEQEMLAIGFPQDAIDNTDVIADLCEEYDMQHSEMVHFTDQPTLLELCKQGAKFRNFKLTKERMQRLNRELELIKQKEYEDYFYLVGDLTRWAKEHMFVGPARGSAAGSLVCFLLRITEVEPIEHGLLFERFIDITRNDLPDIDIDFPDDKRQMVIDYLEQKYGKDKITHIGTVSRYKAKSAIGEVAKKYNIPLSDTEDIKGAIIERSSGDARAQFCIADTFESLQIGKDFLEKYPCMSVVSQVEGHARHSGCHAAGIIVAKTDIQDVCSVNMRYNIAQVDKYTAEKLNLLKIDVLGLRTLSVLNSCLESLGKTPEFLYALDLNDRKAFDIINNGRFSGIFQFEGFSLTSLCKQMIIEEFSDVVALTSLARPGPLNCGGATMFLSRRTGLSEVKYDNEFLKEATEETQGVIVYQEQIMQISKNLGKMSWEDISIIRKAMSKSLGEEFFNRYYEKFRIGAEENGVVHLVPMRLTSHTQ